MHSISDQQARSDKKYMEGSGFRDIGDIREVVALKFDVLSSAVPQNVMLLKSLVI